MLRKLLRVAIKLGLLGAVVAVANEVRRRQQAAADRSAASGAWPPLDLDGDRSRVADPTSTGEAAADEAPAAAVQDAVGSVTPDQGAAAGEAAVADVERQMTAAATEMVTGSSWVDPDGSACPASHPVKAKLNSGVFHLPGMLYYDRTSPDRCYADEAAAEADGLRRAKR